MIFRVNDESRIKYFFWFFILFNLLWDYSRYNNITCTLILTFDIFLKEFKQSNEWWKRVILRLEIIEFRVNRSVIYRNYLLYFIFIVTWKQKLSFFSHCIKRTMVEKLTYLHNAIVKKFNIYIVWSWSIRDRVYRYRVTHCFPIFFNFIITK